MPFFADHTNDLTYPKSEESDIEDYRNCQRGAYWALKSHRTAQGDDPAIISLPTGAGKTALMMLAAFEYKADGVLIIAPSDSIRTQLKHKFDTLEGLSKAGALPRHSSTPDVDTLAERPYTKSQWDEYADTDVVVTLPNSISSKYTRDDEPDVASPPEDMFDLILVDEAHHSSAPAWEEILSGFTSTPQLLLTATPFRRDHDLLPGRLIYHYPVDKARADGIYHQVNLETHNENEEELLETAKRKLAFLQQSNDNAAMLARTDETDTADSLAEEYTNPDEFKLKAVHSDRDADHNQEAIRELRAGEIDGVVIVDKFAEGVDINNLQLAVFHEPPKSLRMTIQLIGRLARSPDDSAPATIIAPTDTLSSEATEEAVRQLYYGNTGWSEIVPDLIDEHISRQRWPTNHLRSQSPTAVNEENIEFYQTTTVYSLTETQIDLGIEEPEIPTDVYRLEASDRSELAGYITMSTDSPNWGAHTVLEFPRYDLHLFYAPPGHELLFQFTSNRQFASELRDELIAETTALTSIDGDQLSKVMQSLQSPKYQTTGLANTAIPSGSQPQYKTYYGEDVQSAVYHSDERTYTHGHVFATFDAGDETETRGVSGNKSKIWTNSKASISEFKSWCDRMAEQLSDESEPGIQNLEGLDTGESISQFDSTPVTVIFNPQLAATPIEFKGGDLPGSVEATPSLELDSTPDAGDTTVDLSLILQGTDTDISCTYDISADKWRGPITNYTVSLSENGIESSSISCHEFLQEYPPRFYTDSGSIVIGGQRQSSQTDLSTFFPQDYLAETQIDWSEYVAEGTGEEPDWYCSDYPEPLDEQWRDGEPESVFEALVRWLSDQRAVDQQILFCDHKSGEVADFIEFCISDNEVNFYHCKGGKSVGVSLGRFKDIYQQTIRSLRFVESMKLIDHINDRRTPDTLQHFVWGEDRYNSLKTDFRPNRWDYTIYGVNPGLNTGFDPEQNDKCRKVGRLLSECVEQVEQVNAKFTLQGANGSW